MINDNSMTGLVFSLNLPWNVVDPGRMRCEYLLRCWPKPGWQGIVSFLAGRDVPLFVSGTCSHAKGEVTYAHGLMDFIHKCHSFQKIDMGERQHHFDQHATKLVASCRLLRLKYTRYISL